jgi:Membrane bound beta barrel domain (DUF5777)
MTHLSRRIALATLALSTGSAWSQDMPANATEPVLGGMSTYQVIPKRAMLVRVSGRFEEPIAPAGENNLFYNLLGVDGPAEWCFALSGGFGPRMEWTFSRETAFKTFGGEIKWQAFSQRHDAKPLNLALTLNSQIRTARGLESDKRVSVGGSLVTAREWWDRNLEFSASLMGQSHTNATQGPSTPDHSVAVGIGSQWHLQPLSLSMEAVVPLGTSKMGYREPFARRNAKGIPSLGAGIHYRSFGNQFTLTVTNDTRMLAANSIAGIQEPHSDRLQEWRLGFSFSRLFYPTLE